jgi:hypothetical protein
VKRILIAFALISVALVVAIWRAPASLIAGLLPPNVSRFVQLHQLTGTVWQGSALFSVTGAPPTLSVTWQCRPSVTPLGLRCELSDSVSAVVTANLFSNTLRADQVSAALPIDFTLSGAAAGSSPNVVATVDQVSASATSLAIEGNVRATDATYRIGGSETSLGELTLDCSPSTDASSTTCSVSNRGGGARVDGRLVLSVDKASGSIELTPTNGPAQRVTF